MEKAEGERKSVKKLVEKRMGRREEKGINCLKRKVGWKEEKS